MEPTPCTVVIARADLTPALRRCLERDPSVVVFGAAETAHALEVIAERRPAVVALERSFAETVAGSDFLSSVREMPTIAEAELRVLQDEGTDIPVLLRRPTTATGRIAIATTSHVLLHREPRRTPRFRVHPGLTAVVNGETTALVNLSVGGAQVLAPAALRPNQHVRVVLPDEDQEIRVSATIAWSILEQCRRTKEAQFRAGVEFQLVNVAALETYCFAHRLDV